MHRDYFRIFCYLCMLLFFIVLSNYWRNYWMCVLMLTEIFLICSIFFFYFTKLLFLQIMARTVIYHFFFWIYFYFPRFHEFVYQIFIRLFGSGVSKFRRIFQQFPPFCSHLLGTPQSHYKGSFEYASNFFEWEIG